MTANRPTSSCVSAGFTLIEVLMAMLIMTVGLMGLLQSLQVAYQHAARNKLRDEAVQLAEEQMNEFRLIHFDNITASSVQTLAQRDLGGGVRNFVINRDCRPVGMAGDRCLPNAGDSKKLSVTVSWQFQDVPLTHAIYTIKNR